MSTAKPSDHQTDTPFGCPKQWGPYLCPAGRGLLADLQLHHCNYSVTGHLGPCECKCGEVKP